MTRKEMDLSEDQPKIVKGCGRVFSHATPLSKDVLLQRCWPLRLVSAYNRIQNTKEKIVKPTLV